MERFASRELVGTSGDIYVLSRFHTASPYSICKVIAAADCQISRHGELKVQLETDLIGRYRRAIRGLTVAGLSLKTIKGRERLLKFRNAQTLKAVAAAFEVAQDSDEDERILMMLAMMHAERGERGGGPRPAAAHHPSTPDDINGFEEENHVIFEVEGLLSGIIESFTLTPAQEASIKSLAADAKINAATKIVKAIVSALPFLDPSTMMGSFVAGLRAVYQPHPVTIEAAREFFASVTEVDQPLDPEG